MKAISDTLEAVLPPIEPFIDAEGQFQTARFVAHVAVRPHLWPSVARLAANQRKASQTICGVLDAILQIEDLRSVRRLKPTFRMF